MRQHPKGGIADIAPGERHMQLAGTGHVKKEVTDDSRKATSSFVYVGPKRSGIASSEWCLLVLSTLTAMDYNPTWNPYCFPLVLILINYTLINFMQDKIK